MLNRGAAHAPSEDDRRQARITAASETARQQWRNALLVDQTRAWMSIGENEAGVLGAMVTMLTIAGFAHAYDTKSSDTPDMNIIRGAVSAATQCMAAGGTVSVADARAFSAAAARADAILAKASIKAISYAAESIRAAVGL